MRIMDYIQIVRIVGQLMPLMPKLVSVARNLAKELSDDEDAMKQIADIIDAVEDAIASIRQTVPELKKQPTDI